MDPSKQNISTTPHFSDSEQSEICLSVQLMTELKQEVNPREEGKYNQRKRTDHTSEKEQATKEDKMPEDKVVVATGAVVLPQTLN